MQMVGGKPDFGHKGIFLLPLENTLEVSTKRDCLGQLGSFGCEKTQSGPET